MIAYWEIIIETTSKKIVARDKRCTHGVKGEMEENRNNTQQIHEKQTQMERKVEEEKNNVSGEIKKRIDSVRQKKTNVTPG